MLSTSQNAVLPLEPHTDSISTINSFNVAPGALNSDLLSPVQARLQAIASSDDFFTRVFGEKANTAEIQAIRSRWAVGDFSIFPKLQIIDAAVMGEAFGAYSQTNQTIYLSAALLAHKADDCMFGATGVLIEEIFHWLDSLVGDDTPGDEGELARHLAFGVTPSEADLSRMSQEQDQGLLWLNGQAVAVEFSGDLAGNNSASARNITLSSTPTTFRDWVGSTDTLDYYRFTLTQTSTVNLSLTDLSADADLSLLDVNGNWLASSWKRGTASESIVKDLNPGTYFIRVQQWSGSTFYNLTVSATTVPDWAGNTFATARNITLSSTPTTFRDWVGSTDTLDYYRFTLTQTSTVNLSLTDLSADADLSLLDVNGNWLASSWKRGTASESIVKDLNPGTYFIRVQQWSGSTFYNLTASATPILPVVTIQATDATAAETNPGQTPNPGRFTLTRTGSTTHPLTVNYTISGTAIGGTDYTIRGTSTSVNFLNRTGTVTFAAGSRTAVIDIHPINDSEFEDPETVVITLANSSAYQIGNSSSATVTIWDNDLPTVTIEATDAEAAETKSGQPPNPGRFTLTRTGSTTHALTVNYSIGGTAIGGTDYTIGGTSTSVNFLNRTGTVTFAAGASTVDILVHPIDDTLVEPSETVILTLLGSSTYQIGTSKTATVTILDNDVASPPVSIPPLTGFNSTYGYGLVNAAAAVARAIGQAFPFPDVPNLGGNHWGHDMVNAPEVWARGYTGSGIVVAVLDTGVDYNHPDLNDNIWRNPGEIAGNGIDDDGNGYIDDVHGWDFINNDNDPLDRNGHGTHVAGTIAAENNGFGVTGVAYNARIMPVQVLGDNGFGSNHALANGIRYAANNGAHVINLSLGSNLPSPEIYSAIQYATSRGVVVVMAAGNDGDPRPDYPAFYATEFGLSVGAVDMNRNIARSSNRAGTDSAMRHVVAPGVSIYSTLPNNSYGLRRGTSMAAPHVAGVVALMLSANPNLTPAQVRDIIAGSAVRLS